MYTPSLFWVARYSTSWVQGWLRKVKSLTFHNKDEGFMAHRPWDIFLSILSHDFFGTEEPVGSYP